MSQENYEYYEDWDQTYITNPQRQRLYGNGRAPRYRVTQFGAEQDEQDENPNRGRGVVGNAVGKASAMITGLNSFICLFELDKT